MPSSIGPPMDREVGILPARGHSVARKLDRRHIRLRRAQGVGADTDAVLTAATSCRHFAHVEAI
jgi:hypothetical protein